MHRVTKEPSPAVPAERASSFWNLVLLEFEVFTALRSDHPIG